MFFLCAAVSRDGVCGRERMGGRESDSSSLLEDMKGRWRVPVWNAKSVQRNVPSNAQKRKGLRLELCRCGEGVYFGIVGSASFSCIGSSDRAIRVVVMNNA